MEELTSRHANAGRSIIEITWEELDRVMDQLMDDWSGETEAYNSDEPLEESLEEFDLEDAVEFGEVRGQAQGLAYALAVLTNPYAVDVPAIKAEALRRYNERNSE